MRNEETLEATEYLNKLPKTLSKDDLVLVSDPMLATGGTIIKVGQIPGISRLHHHSIQYCCSFHAHCVMLLQPIAIPCIAAVSGTKQQQGQRYNNNVTTTMLSRPGVGRHCCTWRRY